MLWTARHKKQLRSNGFWHEKWHRTLLCRSRSSRLTPSVNQERDAALSTLTWTRCLLWSVSKDTPGCWGLNPCGHVEGGLMECPKGAGHRVQPPRSSEFCLADGHKGWVHPCFKICVNLKVGGQMKCRNKLLKGGERHRKQKVLSFPDYTFFSQE